MLVRRQNTASKMVLIWGCLCCQMGDDGQMENLLDRPPMFGMMAPELMNMFQRATKSRAAGRKRRAPTAQLEEVPEAQEAEEAAELAPEAAQTPVDHAEAGPSTWEDAGAGFEEQQFGALMTRVPSDSCEHGCFGSCPVWPDL